MIRPTIGRPQRSQCAAGCFKDARSKQRQPLRLQRPADARGQGGVAPGRMPRPRVRGLRTRQGRRDAQRAPTVDTAQRGEAAQGRLPPRRPYLGRVGAAVTGMENGCARQDRPVFASRSGERLSHRNVERRGFEPGRNRRGVGRGHVPRPAPRLRLTARVQGFDSPGDRGRDGPQENRHNRDLHSAVQRPAG
jgi:hypothetical protein